MAETLHCRQALLADGWHDNVTLALDGGGFIVDIKTDQQSGAGQSLEGAVIPGMPNLHSHGFQVLIGGLTGRRSSSEDSFWTWRNAMYRMAQRVGPEQLEDCMAGVYLRMLRGGFTSCAEFHYLHRDLDGKAYANPAELSDRVISAAAGCGIGLTLLPVLYQRSGFDDGPLQSHQQRFGQDLPAYLELIEHCTARSKQSPGLFLGIAPHSLRAVSPEALTELLAAWRGSGPVHIHIAEQPAEVEQCLTHLGGRPLDWLLDNYQLDPGWCLVHATHTNSGERDRAARAGVVTGLCPSTEADLGDGIFDAVDWIAQGGSFGIGTDSNLRLCVAEELRWLEFGQRLVSGRRNVLADDGQSCGRFIYERAAQGGAQALGQPVGRIEAGCRADLVELDPDNPWLQGLRGDPLLDTYLFAGGADMIRSVWVGGNQLIERGRHAGQEDLEKRFARAMTALRSA